MSKRPTINDVARLSGVSKKTVSRVINDSPNVTQDTRMKVQAIIEQLDYAPDPQARGLAFRRSFLIGLVYDNPNALYISDIQAGILRACRGTGYELIMHPASFSDQRLVEDVQQFIQRARLDGIILLSPISQLGKLARNLKRQHCPYVRISPKKIDSWRNVVVSNDRSGASLMTDYLIGLGHREISFVLGPASNLSSQEKFAGFCEAMQQHRIPVRKRLLVQGANTFASGELAGSQVLGRAVPPTAIFASNDMMALGVLKTAQMMGVDVPRALSVAGYDDSAHASLVWPDLTTVNQSVEYMGDLAAQKLMSQLATREGAVPAATSRVQPQLVIRHSTVAI